MSECPKCGVESGSHFIGSNNVAVCPPKREWVELTDDKSHDLQVYPFVVIVVLIGYLIGFIL